MSFVPTDTGRWVSENYARLAEIIEDYDPQFELRYIPPEARETLLDKEKPYVIWDTAVNQPVLFASEMDSPQEILGRLFDSDNKHGNVLQRIEAYNAAQEAFRMKEKMELAEERQEKVRWLMATKKNYINMGNGRVVDDQLRRIR